MSRKVYDNPDNPIVETWDGYPIRRTPKGMFYVDGETWLYRTIKALKLALKWIEKHELDRLDSVFREWGNCKK